MKCIYCESDEEQDDLKGNIICAGCGRTKASAAITSNLEFANCVLTGRTASMQTGNYSHLKNYGPNSYSSSYSAQRLYLVQKLITDIATSLDIPHHIEQSAALLYKLATERNWVQGRSTTIVVAAILYLECRREGTAHLLIDFSDKLQENLYKIGRTYLKLLKDLRFNVPNIDPCLYICRFCSKLGLEEDQERDVVGTALRIIKSMKRDWMGYGRKPTGLVGASILIAMRYHGFKKDLKAISAVVKVCEETIRRRLVEFKQTVTAKLTVEQFESMDLLKDISIESDPPCFLRNQAQLCQESKDGFSGDSANDGPIKPTAREIIDGVRKTISREKILESNVKEEASRLDLASALEEDESLDVEGFDDQDVDSYLLSAKESNAKSLLWHQLKDNIIWEEMQKVKIERIAEKAALGAARKRCVRRKLDIIDAKDSSSALCDFSKFGSRFDPEMVGELFGCRDGGDGAGVSTDFGGDGDAESGIGSELGGSDILEKRGCGFFLGGDHENNVESFKKLKLF